MDHRLIFLDIDGTLLPPGDMLVPESTLAALDRAKANGHKLFLYLMLLRFIGHLFIFLRCSAPKSHLLAKRICAVPIVSAQHLIPDYTGHFFRAYQQNASGLQGQKFCLIFRHHNLNALFRSGVLPLPARQLLFL